MQERGKRVWYRDSWRYHKCNIRQPKCNYCRIRCNFCPVFVLYVALVLIFLRFCNITGFVCYILVRTKKATPYGIAFGSVVKDDYFPTRGYFALWLCAYALRAALSP